MIPKISGQRVELSLGEFREDTKAFLLSALDHVKEVTDAVWRGGLIGVFTGVGLIFGVPGIGAMIGTALFGGEKIAKVVQRIVPGGGN